MSLADVYYQTSACLQLVWTSGADLTLKFHQILWQGMYALQTQGCFAHAPGAAVGYLATKGQLVATYDTGALLPAKQRVRARL